MARQNCPNRDRGPGRYTPAPLYQRITVPEPAEEAAAPLAPVPSAARQTLAEADLRIRRYTNPVPAAPTSAECEALCLLRQQNALLTDILGALNAQLAARFVRP